LRNFNNKPESEFTEKVIAVNRVTKVVAGGKNLSFSALVIVGNGKGQVGFGKGKAKEFSDAVKKAVSHAKRNLVKIPIKDGRTISYDAVGDYCATQMVLRSAPAGTGIIAGGHARSVFEVAGIHDIVCKSIGSNNPYNSIYALFKVLRSMKTPRSISNKRGLSVSEIYGQQEEHIAKYAKLMK